MQTRNYEVLNSRSIGRGEVFGIARQSANWQAVASGAGQVSVKITVYGAMSPDGPWEPIITLNPSGASQASDSGATSRAWHYGVADLTEINGTGAQAILRMEA